MNEQELVNKYIVAPYKHMGRDLNGLDCWGLIKCVYADLGFKLWDIDEKYDEKWAWKGKDHFIENYWREWLKIEKPALFDGVLFCNKHGAVFHAGVMLSGNKVLHTCKKGTIVTRLDLLVQQYQLAGFYHLKARDDKG